MNTVTILHNPGCSKSRATLELLAERGIVPRIVDYLRAPPGIEELEQLLALLGLQPRELMRRDESAYLSNGLDDPNLGRAELLAALHAHPQLIQRPIVIAGGKAAIGRPPEAVLDIL
ncbi:MAG: arsenate reductase (glutaredoxin) [Dokdonella sp.]|uniref:arsenate reductase (glutaredoxin) n=1 Tax=Dokdonella sp. TaxID=2291710 RepID=UPI003BAF962F